MSLGTPGTISSTPSSMRPRILPVVLSALPPPIASSHRSRTRWRRCPASPARGTPSPWSPAPSAPPRSPSRCPPPREWTPDFPGGYADPLYLFRSHHSSPPPLQVRCSDAALCGALLQEVLEEFRGSSAGRKAGDPDPLALPTGGHWHQLEGGGWTPGCMRGCRGVLLNPPM